MAVAGMAAGNKEKRDLLGWKSLLCSVRATPCSGSVVVAVQLLQQYDAWLDSVDKVLAIAHKG